MHLFDYNDKLKKYSKVGDIIDDYFHKRLELYDARKKYMISALEKELVLLSNKAKYINEVLEDTVDLRKKTKEQVILMLESKGYDRIDDEDSKKDYKYLIRMPMDSVTEENVRKLLKEHGDKTSELEAVKNMTLNRMWLSELGALKEAYLAHKIERAVMLSNVQPEGKAVLSKKVKKTKVSTSI
jgi:DNA topoisomerase-2